MKKILIFLSVFLFGCGGGGGGGDSIPENPDSIAIAYLVSTDNPYEMVAIADTNVSDEYFEIYTTENGGKRWDHISVFLEDYATRLSEGEGVIRLFAGTKNLSTIYIETEPLGTIGHAGIFTNPYILRKYTQGEIESNKIYQGDNGRYEVVINTDESTIIYASETDMGGPGGPSSLMASIDNGNTFYNVNSNNFFPRWDFFPESQEYIGCQMSSFAATFDGFLLVECYGLFISNDAGISWQNIQQPPNFIYLPRKSRYPLFTMHISTVDHGIIYAFDKVGQTLYKLSGLAESWETIIIPAEVESLTLSNDNAAIIYLAAGQVGGYESIDGGLSWAKINNIPANTFTRKIHISQTRLIIETDQGIFML